MLRNKKVLVLGFSVSGIAAAKYTHFEGADVFVSEYKKRGEYDDEPIYELEKLGIKTEFGSHSDEFCKDTDLCIASPSIPLNAPVFEKIKCEIISDVELAYRCTKTPIIVVTGTNGKTTTTSLISHILSYRYKAPCCGNIGVSPVDFINEKNDYLICEMSSYQLTRTPSLKPFIACFLTFTPDHLNWHGGLDNYFKAKASLFEGERKPEYAVFNAMDEKIAEFAKNYPGKKFMFAKEYENNCCYIKNNAIYFKGNTETVKSNVCGKTEEEKIIEIKDVPIVGMHNLQNVMAGVICAKLANIDNKTIEKAVKTFKAVEHRCEFVKEKNGIVFYNDSKATNPEAAMVAIKSFGGKKISLIAGGRDKNTDLTDFCTYVNDCIDNVVLIGEAAERFKKELVKSGFLHITNAANLEDAIQKSIESKPDVVLFSPACASFDMFKNYEERGKAFKDYVFTKV